ncbi:MAG TPA: YgiQ family radical SAM protein [Gammaproteobacteria bacterium]|nr:YgiQ family radical SAM protein [Gammaproteobacteria bacterium]
MHQAETGLFSRRKYWAHRFGVAGNLPMSREEMDHLGWDSCDIIIVTGDAYVDHPSFGMALIGRLLEAQGFRVGIISQPDWTDRADLMSLGQPNLYFGVTAGNMDSMVNRYTADRKIRSDDSYTAGGEGGLRPDRAVIVYSQMCRQAYKGTPVIIGGIEASLRRISHFDYWSEKVRRSVLLDSKADLLVFGNAERQMVEISHRLANGEQINELTDIRGTALTYKQVPGNYKLVDYSLIDTSGVVLADTNPYQSDRETECKQIPDQQPGDDKKNSQAVSIDGPHKTAIVLPSYEQVRSDKKLYAHTSRIMHLETNPGNARALIQEHNGRYLFLNPPALPLSTRELDKLFELPYTRLPHPAYETKKISAYEMIRFSINIMRGCFGGCTFCSITEHEGRIIQSRSENSIIREIETIRDTVPGFTGNISDLGGPTANMYNLGCNSSEVEAVCRRLSCVYPVICKNLNTNHETLIRLYKRARQLPGIKRIFIASGVRYDLAVQSPEYVRELVGHHVGGYLKIAPEHTENGPLSKMMKPGMGVYYKFRELFDKYSEEAGKEQYLIPYFIAAHPGTTDEDMLELALWLKANDYRADQVQTFLPSPMALATSMWHTGYNPLRSLKMGERMASPRGNRKRRLHKAFLRYHDSKNWPLLREALKQMGRADLIGNGKKHLVPRWQPESDSSSVLRKRGNKNRSFRTTHTGKSG